jgi:hypothetical protein
MAHSNMPPILCGGLRIIMGEAPSPVLSKRLGASEPVPKTSGMLGSQVSVLEQILQNNFLPKDNV